LGYIAVTLGERQHGRRQRVRSSAMHEIRAHFIEGMILLLPPRARELPAWGRLQGPEMAFA
jgi:hypothetical protein